MAHLHRVFEKRGFQGHARVARWYIHVPRQSKGIGYRVGEASPSRLDSVYNSPDEGQ